MPSQIVRDLAATGGVTDMHGILQAETRGKRRKIVSVMIHVVTVARLRGPAVAAAVMGDHAIAVTQKKQHLRVPVICRQRPAMAEHDGLTLAPVLVEDLNAVFGRDGGHSLSPYLSSLAHHAHTDINLRSVLRPLGQRLPKRPHAEPGALARRDANLLPVIRPASRALPRRNTQASRCARAKMRPSLTVRASADPHG